MKFDLDREKCFEANIGDVIITDRIGGYYIVTSSDNKEDCIEIKAMGSTYTVSEYSSIGELNNDLDDGFFVNLHTGKARVLEVIKSEDLIITRGE